MGLLSSVQAYYRRRFLHLIEGYLPDSLRGKIKMHDSQEHVFTNEFDDICIAISLNMDTAAASMQVTISERNRVWDELLLVSADNPHWGTSRG